MATTDTERYVRLTLLTFEGGTWIAKEILLREVARASVSLSSLLNSHQRALKTKRRDNGISKNQHDIIMQTITDENNLKLWDLQLLVKMILFLFYSTLPGHDKTDLKYLLVVRNELICHNSQPRIGEKEFVAPWTKLTGCLTRLSFFEASVSQHVEQMIVDLASGPLDLQSSISKVSELCKNDEHMEDAIAALSRIERTQCQVATGVSSANVKLDKLTNKVDEMNERIEKLGLDRSSFDIPILQSQVSISCRNEELGKLTGDIVLKVFKAAISIPTIDHTDDRAVYSAARKIVNDLESMGVNPVSAEKGSILLSIHCISLQGLFEMLQMYRNCLNRFRLVGIEEALSETYKEDIRVEMVLSEDSIELISKWIDEQLSTVKRQNSESRQHTSDLTMKLQCDSLDSVLKVADYFQNGGLSNRLNQLSEALSANVNDTVKVEATLNVDEFDAALCTANFGAEEEIRILLVGRTGHGKSSVGNTLLGFDAFEVSPDRQPCTKTCKSKETVRDGVQLVVCDTPGLFDTSLSNGAIFRQLMKALLLTVPGFHVIAFVLKPERFTEEMRKTKEEFFEWFGDGVSDYFCIICTHTENDKELLEYIEDPEPVSASFLKDCNGAIFPFEKKALPSVKDAQVRAFLQHVRKIKGRNVSNYFTNPLYRMACDIAHKREKERQENESRARDMEAKKEREKQEQERRTYDIAVEKQKVIYEQYKRRIEIQERIEKTLKEQKRLARKKAVEKEQFRHEQEHLAIQQTYKLQLMQEQREKERQENESRARDMEAKKEREKQEQERRTYDIAVEKQKVIYEQYKRRIEIQERIEKTLKEQKRLARKKAVEKEQFRHEQEHLAIQQTYKLKFMQEQREKERQEERCARDWTIEKEKIRHEREHLEIEQKFTKLMEIKAQKRAAVEIGKVRQEQERLATIEKYKRQIEKIQKENERQEQERLATTQVHPIVNSSKAYSNFRKEMKDDDNVDSFISSFSTTWKGVETVGGGVLKVGRGIWKFFSK